MAKILIETLIQREVDESYLETYLRSLQTQKHLWLNPSTIIIGRKAMRWESEQLPNGEKIKVLTTIRLKRAEGGRK